MLATMHSVIANNKRVFKKIFDNCDNFLFDCDGVLWHANEPIKGAIQVVNQLQKSGKNVTFITNNSTKTREQYLEKLSKMGFTAKKEQIFGTAYTSALYLKNIAKVTGKVYLVGNDAMEKELQDVEISCFGNGPDSRLVSHDKHAMMNLPFESDVQAVLVGFDGHFSFTKMLVAATYLNDPKCLYVATNEDHRMPLPGSKLVIPGTGCLIEAVTVAADRSPVWMGKPGKFMFQCIQNVLKINPERTIMIGDRMNTDILFGKRNGLKTMLVLTGIETEDSIESAANSTDPSKNEQVPDYYTPSIGDWSELFD